MHVPVRQGNIANEVLVHHKACGRSTRKGVIGLGVVRAACNRVPFESCSRCMGLNGLHHVGSVCYHRARQAGSTGTLNTRKLPVLITRHVVRRMDLN